MRNIGPIEQKVIDAQQKKELKERAGIKQERTEEERLKIEKLIKQLKIAGEKFLSTVPDLSKN